jgi:translation initiation factor IF-2
MTFKKFNSSLIRLFLTDNKSMSEDLLCLTNPLTVVIYQVKNQSSLHTSLTADVPQELLTLNSKPSLKIDKKNKKNDKDEDIDIDRTSAKLKLKKKTRSKVSFEEEFDSVNELFETLDPLENPSLLPLARPAKPNKALPSTLSFVLKQKITQEGTPKKRKLSSTNKKKEFDDLQVNKPSMVSITQPLTVQELADLFVVSKTDIIKSLFLKGIAVTVNQTIDLLTVQKLGQEFGVEVSSTPIDEYGDKKFIGTSKDSPDFVPRPPIITIMGHVDHGKTTLLDKIRKTQTAQKEAGGITQKIGAYEVNVNHKTLLKRLIFLDTPGHAAFSGMRYRGVSITDIVVLVVAADDGVKPQTLEAIKYIQSAKVPLIVAINKIDKDDSNVDTIKEELAKYNLISEDWGGDTLMVPISAMQGTNIDTLLEMIILLSEMLDLQANPNASAEGTVIESHLDRTRGAVASLIVQNGTLRIGDVINVGGTVAKVRGMVNSDGESLREASPSSPVLIWGLSKVPSVGDYFSSFKDEKEAKLYTNSGLLTSRSSGTHAISDTYTVSDSENKERINLIIKTDTQGSAEAISSSVGKFDDPKVQVRILYACAGEVTETDVEFASTSNATLLAFNTTSASGAKKTAKNASIEIKEFNVIYDLFDYVESLIELKVGPQYDENLLGSAIVRTVFPLAKSFVAGSLVTEGRITKSSFIHIIRGSEIIYKGFINSLKRLKEDVLEVLSESECGIFIKEFDTWKQGDIIKAFELIPRKKNTF